MDWLSKLSWEHEDAMYSPKRKVSNRGSQERPHIIGSFHSFKMNRGVEYESLGESLLLDILELDRSTVRYYVQPVEVPIPVNKNGILEHWIHVPDVLVFRQGSIPHLYQVKDNPDEVSEKLKRINDCCIRYAAERNWNYSVVNPKGIPTVYADNLKFLVGFLQPRDYFDAITPEVIRKLQFLSSSTIEDLAEEFSMKIHPLHVLPVIYYLIAKGIFSVSLDHPINAQSLVSLSTGEESPVLHLGEVAHRGF